MVNLGNLNLNFVYLHHAIYSIKYNEFNRVQARHKQQEDVGLVQDHECSNNRILLLTLIFRDVNKERSSSKYN